MYTAVGSAVSFLSLGLTAALRPSSGGVEKPIGGSYIGFFRVGDFGNPSE